MAAHKYFATSWVAGVERSEPPACDLGARLRLDPSHPVPNSGRGRKGRVKKILDTKQIHHGVCQLAEEGEAIYGGRPITIVASLTGSLVLLADLIREPELPLRVAVIQASRLPTSDEPRESLVISDTLLPSLKDRDVLVIDDI